MKVLTFDGEQARQRFEVLYDGLANTERTMLSSELRVHSRILGKMESIGTPAERGGMATFTLNGQTQIMELEDVEYKLMAECLEKVPWHSKARLLVLPVLDFFEEAGK